MCLGVDRLPPCEKPDGDGTDNGGETENEAELAEKFQLSGFHIDDFNCPKRDKIPQCIFSELAKSLSENGEGFCFGWKGPLAALIVDHRPLRVCFLLAPCQSTPPQFQTGSKGEADPRACR